MKKYFHKNLAVTALTLATLILPLAAFGQTPVSMPKNKNNISKDIEIGRKSAAEVDKTFPMVNDRASDAYINEVGNRLANAVPPEFQHREFNCKFNYSAEPQRHNPLSVGFYASVNPVFYLKKFQEKESPPNPMGRWGGTV